MSPMSAESTVVRNYLDWLLSMPWGKAKPKKIDIAEAEAILDEDHYGLEKVKERILEYLAVQARTNSLKGPILCLVGPSRRRQDLAGPLHRQGDGARVRAPVAGRRAGRGRDPRPPPHLHRLDARQDHPVDEEGQGGRSLLPVRRDRQDGSDYRGDPSSALLEVLDPAQNSTFADHYLEVDYDLSQTMFVTTANSLNMPQPLLDRMEIIRIPGYTEEEKIEIAKRHVLPKLTKDHGLTPEEFVVPEKAIRDLIRYYTREAGVRSLERELGNLARKVVRAIWPVRAC